MEYRTLGKTRQTVSRVGLGTLAFGGHYGAIEKIQAVRTVHAAIDAGITFFDTSPTYGDGRAEDLLGEALGSHLDRVFIATKIGAGNVSDLRVWRNNDRATIITRLEKSLKRLRRDYVDLYQIYGPDPHTPIKETLEALEGLRTAGKIRFIGSCDAPREVLLEALKVGRMDCVQAPYNLMEIGLEPEALRFCRAAGIPLLACEPFGSGLLHGRFDLNTVFELDDVRVRDRRFRGSEYRRNIEIVNRLRSLAEQEGMTLTELALGWLLRNPLVGVAVCGARSPQHIREIVAAGNIRLASEQARAAEQTVGGHEVYQAAESHE